MKKSLWILATIALFFVGDRAVGLLLKKAVDSSQFRYSRMYSGQAQSDILLVGNSRGLIFYQPIIEEITSKKTFNISYNGMPIDLANTLVKDYLEKYNPPKTMIVDITMCDRLNKPLESGFNLYTPYSKGLSELIKENDRNGFYGAQLSHLYRYNTEIFQRALFYLKKNDEDWLLDRVINDHLIANVGNEKKIEFGIDDKQVDHLPEMLNYLSQMVLFAKSKDVKVVLVINPYYPEFVQKIANLQELKNKVEVETGLKVYDYSSAVTDQKGFADYQHLNKYGAKLYLDILKRDGLLE